MLSWKPLQDASAFRAYCKGIGKDISEYDNIAKNIELYTDDPKWRKLIEDSKVFVGVIESVSESPCSMLLYDKPVRKELGMIRTSKGEICCMLDGLNCDHYKYLKNDYLTVTVWAIIRDVCKLAGIPIPTISEFNKLLDDKTFEVYAKGLTSTINQADSQFGTSTVMTYKPQNVSEMSAFVAIIRPGCASLLQDFIDRKPYTTGVPELDEILKEGNHRMIYQELIMKYLIWLGIPETGSYDIIKKIAKKKFKEEELAELKEKLIQGWVNRVGKEDGFQETWSVVEDAARYSFNACVSGDTKIQRAGNTGHWVPTIQEMYRIKNDPVYAKETGHADLHKKYIRYGYGNALSMFDDKRIRKNHIIDIKYSGKAPIFRVTVDSGEHIDCTLNHKFPTKNGKKQLFDLSVGDVLFVKDGYEVNRNKYLFTNGNYKKNTPIHGERGFQSIPDGNSVLFLSKQKKCFDEKMPCSICGKDFSPDLRFELHHKDLDRTNNNDENLQWLCCSCHKKEHYRQGRIKAYEKGIPTKEARIVSINFIRVDDVYDIEMEDPAHTFISESGLVTSNSHSLSYAYDSLYGAYLKSHYPLEYYTVALKYYSGDAERTMRLTDELKYFNIELKPIKFRFSKADYAISRDDNSIYKGIESIKEMNAKMADELYCLRKNHYGSFADLLYDVSNETSVKKNQMRILIELDYFEEFGDANALLKQYELFNSLSERKSLKKTELESIGVTLEEASPYAASVTEKLLNNMDMESFLRNLLSKVKTNPRSLKETITAQVEYLGYISIKDDRYKGMAAVVEVDTKYSPKLKLYSLKNGTTLDCKIDKKTFNKQKLEKGDILRIAETKSKPKVKKNEDGDWVTVPGTKELWITKYFILNNM